MQNSFVYNSCLTAYSHFVFPPNYMCMYYVLISFNYELMDRKSNIHQPVLNVLARIICSLRMKKYIFRFSRTVITLQARKMQQSPSKKEKIVKFISLITACATVLAKNEKNLVCKISIGISWNLFQGRKLKGFDSNQEPSYEQKSNSEETITC